VLPIAFQHCREHAALLARFALLPPEEDPRRAPLLLDLEQAQLQLQRYPHRQSAKLAVEEIQSELQALERGDRQVDPLLLEEWTALFAKPGVIDNAEPDELRAVFYGLLAEIRVNRGGETVTPIARPL
jgi:hypothetical protein